MTFKTFIRDWWKDAEFGSVYYPGLEPCAGKKKWCDEYDTEDEARAACQEYNRTHDAGRYSRKMEYTETSETVPVYEDPLDFFMTIGKTFK